MLEPIDYQRAVRDLMARRRRRKLRETVHYVTALRSPSAGQITLVGLILVFVGWAVPALHPLSLAGFAVLVIGFVVGVIRLRADNATTSRTNPRPPGKRGGGDPPLPRPFA